eukprot:CAMPEP_0177768704 /NCGR_PEP_ID=MMETSP0491_2-20121128/9873_1 /TAXON_ID=63592 /ORGANISM="Tetraselmis chuii, Strain PLY429" /LENGTH=110 /DNA_ID=CAMNT_0019285549 /DNA_START=73 /DNA_END=405 /DNA_ORIENTATION=+
MYAVASKSTVMAAKPVVATRRPARAQVKVVGSAENNKKGESMVAQRRTVFAGLAAALAAASIAPQQARAAKSQAQAQQGGQAGQNDTEPVTRACSNDPTSKECQEEAAKR